MLYGHYPATLTLAQTDALMTADPKVRLSHIPSIGGQLVNMGLTAPIQALQHIYHKSGYNYQKTTSQVHLGTLMSGPGIVSAEGAPHCVISRAALH